jgi:hypothetical protein
VFTEGVIVEFCIGIATAAIIGIIILAFYKK